MTPNSPCSTFLTGVLVALSLIQPSVAQLSSCDAVNCLLDEYNKPTCSVGNTTAQAIGISNFSIPISSQELTWTVAVQSLNETQSTFERDFFLGTPADLNLKARSSLELQVCAIFFNGAANKASFPGDDPEYSQGTCDDALATSCVNDIHDQAQAFRLEDYNGSNKSNSFCEGLGKALSIEAPQSCTIASGHEWSDVEARPLTGSDVPDLLQKSNCTPTTGHNYALT
ncbi:MAG: hypothetical protein Q9225_007965 [Loekoesia sp. 1 TL-2023]